MNFSLSFLAVVAFGLFALGGAARHSGEIRCPRLPHSHRFIKRIFTSADANQDGNLDDTEYHKNLFREFDYDADGRVTRDEFLRKFLELDQGHENEASKLFAAGDVNRNGYLDDDDKTLAKYRIDLNDDGEIGECEFQLIWTKIADSVQIGL
ncbi:uncharacterized protein LOC106177616 [Lingula anatina]|uniref:Uncharacterized protein LOC106177616 n=1 Tax=Lingula anatina TaxID=7574 RepID=A0A1S3K038_LINAN|nr:uncharacterized protein LOC106177616 [Lingula anatina]XP_013415908.1 uncharacterized protein LOC106177616 [Lingula anatina]|eukprot:XP_013415907.1 uncharacterized protein LOC106177616 [Lingula anatina]